MEVRYLLPTVAAIRVLTRQLSMPPQEKIKVHVRQGLGQHGEKKHNLQKE